MQYEITNVLLKKFGRIVFAIFYEWLMQDSLSVLRISVHKFEALSYLLDRACVEKKSDSTRFRVKNWLKKIHFKGSETVKPLPY